MRILSREVGLRGGSGFGVGGGHFEAGAQRLGRARPLAAKHDAIPFKRFCPGKRVCTPGHGSSLT